MAERIGKEHEREPERKTIGHYVSGAIFYTLYGIGWLSNQLVPVDQEEMNEYREKIIEDGV